MPAGASIRMTGIPVRSAAAVIAASAAIAISLAACSSGGPDQPTSAPLTSSPATASASTPVSADAGVQRVTLSTPIDHAHGLVVSNDGSLLVGTHTGVRSVVTDGKAVRIGTAGDDLMGMTGIPGTERLISSGHPGGGSTLANPLGLMTNKDGGRSWTSTSLAGQADFHALATDGDLVTGFDGVQGIRISRDGGKTWTQGAAIAASALAMTPGSVWATTQQGLQRSTDNGHKFSPVPGTPVLRLVVAGQDHSLWGVDVNGYAWRSRDGASWQRRAQVGQIEAIAAANHAKAYAITDKQLHILT